MLQERVVAASIEDDEPKLRSGVGLSLHLRERNRFVGDVRVPQKLGIRWDQIGDAVHLQSMAGK